MTNMAVNVYTAFIWGLQLIIFLKLFSPTTSAKASYKVINPNKISASYDESLALKFASHPRYRRQADSSASTIPVSPDQSSPAQTTALPGSSRPNVDVTANSSTTPLSTTFKPSTVAGSTVSSTTPLNKASDAATTKAASTTVDPFFESDIIHDHHDYYETDVLKNKVSEYWQELADTPRHETLSTGHRVAAVIALKFPFHFYGHEVKNITIATGGFIYMSPFLHQWLTATQYIAPLMANFDPSLSKESGVYYKNDETKFTVEWKNVMLRDQNNSGLFNFQAILHKDDTIHFVYKSVPIPIRSISTDEHPVKVGLSDAYYNDTYVPEYKIKRRTIYEYHKVLIRTEAVTSGSVVVLKPLPTCNRLSDCKSCIEHKNVAFDCRWCNTIGRCSDGLDWYRQHWDREGCQQSSVSEKCTDQPTLPAPTAPVKKVACAKSNDTEDCENLPPPEKPLTDSVQDSTDQTCQNGNCNVKSDFPVAVVVIVVLIIAALLASMAGWVYYAYTHPTSKSGMWLMEHRPSQMRANIKFWKSSSDAGTKYKVESET
ncbi:plexin domain-containing protein 1-like isoform X2 [Physella acuta]|uniref:plexin domain-containing protein 1-like isoform X2 n=1 Tax=Physella acuta TaxID=109671 RepID=UPI0027DDD9FC|nr:plexin domain-containing protein 1-like isoform X2 [Physella acuta]